MGTTDPQGRERTREPVCRVFRLPVERRGNRLSRLSPVRGNS